MRHAGSSSWFLWLVLCCTMIQEYKEGPLRSTDLWQMISYLQLFAIVGNQTVLPKHQTALDKGERAHEADSKPNHRKLYHVAQFSVNQVLQQQGNKQYSALEHFVGSILDATSESNRDNTPLWWPMLILCITIKEFFCPCLASSQCK